MDSILHLVLFEDVVNSLKNGFSFAMKIGKNHEINENVQHLPPLNFERVFLKTTTFCVVILRGLNNNFKNEK
jgi:hypothetical protein